MPGSVTAPASLASRLPSATLKDSQGNALSYTQQSKALQRLSRNAQAPGGSLKRPSGTRSARRTWNKRCAELGIILIEADVTGALAANVGCVPPPNVQPVTIDTNAGTPATTDIVTLPWGEMDAATWAGAGTKTLSVTVPANCLGQALVTV